MPASVLVQGNAADQVAGADQLEVEELFFLGCGVGLGFGIGALLLLAQFGPGEIAVEEAVRLKEAEARGSTAASLTDMPLNAKSEELQATAKQLEARIQALVSEVETKDALVEELRQESAKAVARSDSQLQRELEQLKLQSAETAKAQAAADAAAKLKAAEDEKKREERAQRRFTCASESPFSWSQRSVVTLPAAAAHCTAAQPKR